MTIAFYLSELGLICCFYSRVKRDYDAQGFEDEINDCVEGRCTLIRCTVGPLMKDESVLFKIRSRLFTETQKEV